MREFLLGEQAVVGPFVDLLLAQIPALLEPLLQSARINLGAVIANHRDGLFHCELQRLPPQFVVVDHSLHELEKGLVCPLSVRPFTRGVSLPRAYQIERRKPLSEQ